MSLLKFALKWILPLVFIGIGFYANCLILVVLVLSVLANLELFPLWEKLTLMDYIYNLVPISLLWGFYTYILYFGIKRLRRNFQQLNDS